MILTIYIYEQGAQQTWTACGERLIVVVKQGRHIGLLSDFSEI